MCLFLVYCPDKFTECISTTQGANLWRESLRIESFALVLLMCLSRAVAMLWRSVYTMILVAVLPYFYGWKNRGTAASFECWDSTVSKGAGTGTWAFEQWYGVAVARCCMHPYVPFTVQPHSLSRSGCCNRTLLF